MDAYNAFLKSKVRMAESWGFDIAPDDVNPVLKPHQRAIVQGRRGIGIELSPAYFLDGAAYCKAAADQVAMPGLFDVLEAAEAVA